MNIVYFYPHLKHAGGIERILTAKANYMADVLGYNVTIITYRQFNGKNYFNLSEDVVQINLDIEDPSIFKNNDYKKKDYKKFLFTYKNLIEDFLLKNPQDIAISLFFGKEFNFLPLIKDNSKKILELHFNFQQTTLINKKEIIKLKNFQDLKNFYYINKLEKIISMYDKLVVLSKNDLKNWQKKFKNATYIYNFSPIKHTGEVSLNSKSVISVGRLTHQKGFDRLISAWKIVNEKHPDWILNIFGNGELENDLKNQIKSLGLESNINIKSSTKNIANEYLKSSLYVMSSRFEGFPMVLLEASQLGLPCVSFDCNYGPSEIIINEYDGYLVEQENINSFAEKIIFLIDNENIRKNFSIRSIKKMEKFDIEIIMNNWKYLFENMINNKEEV